MIHLTWQVITCLTPRVITHLTRAVLDIKAIKEMKNRTWKLGSAQQQFHHPTLQLLLQDKL